MKALIIMSLIAAFASPAIAEVVSSSETGKAHCKIMEAKEKLLKEIRGQSVQGTHTAGDARG